MAPALGKRGMTFNLGSQATGKPPADERNLYVCSSLKLTGMEIQYGKLLRY
jgi:hypothetical protein